MSLLDLFRTIGDAETLGQFIDQHAERSGRGIVDDYLRARAGAAAKQLFATPNFLAVRDQAQHEAYPVALAMIGEMIAGVLAAPSSEIAPDVARGLATLAGSLFDRRVPLLPGPAWAKARHETSQSLAALASDHPKPVAAVAGAFAPSFLALMPMHDRLSPDDFPALRINVETALRDIHSVFARRASARRLVVALTAVNANLAENPP